MSWEAFERRARSAIPQQELKPKRCWIGVLSHVKSLDDELEEADFIWMIGHGVSHSETLLSVQSIIAPDLFLYIRMKT
jgi:hypothetical protein